MKTTSYAPDEARSHKTTDSDRSPNGPPRTDHAGQADQTSKADQTDKSSPLRLLLLSALLLLVGARVIFASPSSAVTTASARYTTPGSYKDEVFAALDEVPCRFLDDARLRARLHQLPEHLDSWRQTARVEASEILRSLRRIAAIQNCPAAANLPALESVALHRKALSDDLERSLRSQFARLRRAQKEGDAKNAHASVTSLQNLLEHHQGPLSEHLSRLARQYQQE